jgi:hypothetical protein
VFKLKNLCSMFSTRAVLVLVSVFRHSLPSLPALWLCGAALRSLRACSLARSACAPGPAALGELK